MSVTEISFTRDYREISKLSLSGYAKSKIHYTTLHYTAT